jgi:hypothetical protein
MAKIPHDPSKWRARIEKYKGHVRRFWNDEGSKDWRVVMRYLDVVLKLGQVPPDTAIAHNHGRIPGKWRRPGYIGWRIEAEPIDDWGIEPCPCGWAPELGIHYRVKCAPTP